jgi:hypothetical protein
MASGYVVFRNPITGIAGCCARAVMGHVAAPPSAVMNSLRRMSPIRPSSSPGMATSHRPAPAGRSAAESAYRRPAGKSLGSSESFSPETMVPGEQAKSASVK